MKIAARLSLILFILTSALRARAEVGMGDWQCYTPGGNTIDNFSDNHCLTLTHSSQVRRLENMERWYFYKGYVIGQLDKGYFIVNEATLKVDSFTNERVWTSQLKQYKLSPLIWTRWYNNDWTPFQDIFTDNLQLLFMSPFIAVGIAIYLFILYNAIRHEKFRVKKPATIAVLLITFVVASIYLLEQFPQSF